MSSRSHIPWLGIIEYITSSILVDKVLAVILPMEAPQATSTTLGVLLVIQGKATIAMILVTGT